MRKIVAGLFITLDGVVEAPETWTGPHFNDEIGQQVAAAAAASDTMLLGRVTYQTFAAAFAGQSGGMADLMNNMPKIVVSTTLDSANWRNSTLVSHNITERIVRLKHEPGKDIRISGSATLVRALLCDKLLDELNLMVFPVVLGSGTRLFDGVDQLPLRLVDANTFSTGVLNLTYQAA